tara:strand:- start:1181 stop:1918 length:738 start_codon:yes stop_codon:yes gene_type:complete
MYVNLKKKYGQNFLIDRNISSKIINLINQYNLNILEIGPGDGKLTEKILEKKPNNLDIIEIDNDLIKELNKKFLKYKFINIINNDVIKSNLDKDYDLVISNLPYNLSSKVLEKLILIKNLPKTMILMFQKEFAERLLSENLNSINSLVKCFFSLELKFNVSKNCFRPIPKIQSSVLVFNKLNKSLISKNEIESFIKFKRYIFSYKRKTLRKILKKYNIENSFNLDLRAENLNLSDLIKIFRVINF